MESAALAKRIDIAEMRARALAALQREPSPSNRLARDLLDLLDAYEALLPAFSK